MSTFQPRRIQKNQDITQNTLLNRLNSSTNTPIESIEYVIPEKTTKNLFDCATGGLESQDNQVEAIEAIEYAQIGNMAEKNSLPEPVESIQKNQDITQNTLLNRLNSLNLETQKLEDKPFEVSHLWDAITSNLTELATELRQRLSDYPSMVMLSEWVDTNHIRNRTHPKPVTSRAELEELIQTTRAVTPKNAVYVALRVAYNPLEPQDLYLLAGNGTALYNANKTK